MNALRAITYWWFIFYWYECPMGNNRLVVHFLLIWMPYGQWQIGGSFSIDMNALWAIAAISHREIMSIERIRCMYCFVRRTLTTKSERKYFNIAPIFYTPAARNEAAEAIRKVYYHPITNSCRFVFQEIKKCEIQLLLIKDFFVFLKLFCTFVPYWFSFRKYLKSKNELCWQEEILFNNPH